MLFRKVIMCRSLIFRNTRIPPYDIREREIILFPTYNKEEGVEKGDG